MTHEQTLFTYVGAFVEELARARVRHVVICPGSRSTPLALMLARQPELRLWTLVDERSAAFFALGLAKAGGRAVALVCTSGTAAANFYPAVVEAHYSRVPLLVLTADRPPEQRDLGAAQTIDQARLYGVHAKWFVEMPLPEATPTVLRYARLTAARAVATAEVAPAGPVHLNFPFREPLVPAPPPPGQVPPLRASEAAPYLEVLTASHEPGQWADGLARRLAEARRGLIVCGPQDELMPAMLIRWLATTLGWPILADPLSGLRCWAQERELVVDSYDAFLRGEAWVAGYAPDVILRFGALPTSKPLLLYLQAQTAAHHVLVADAGGWHDPTLLADEVIWTEPGAFCRTMDELVRELLPPPRPLSAWTAAWQAANRQARAALNAHLATIAVPFEGKVYAELADLLPDRATLFVGNSMPVRDLDTFFPATAKSIRILANRGANGIDGVVSSALGASVLSDGPLVLAIGDLSFYHDLNGLLAAKLYGLRATIILLNNDGGGIFSFLPQAEGTPPARFEQLYGTPTGLDFRLAVEMYGGRFVRPADWPAFRTAVEEGMAGDGLTVIEVRTDRAQNVAQHRALWPLVAAAIQDTEEAGA